jgi:hypothetical protein
MRRTVVPLVIALIRAPSIAAQQPQLLAAGPRDGDPPPVVSNALHAAMLKPAYLLRLVSDWPQLSGGGLGCVNGGQEVLEGKLTQTSSGEYAGQLTRKGTIRFCGVHGGAAEACALTLTSGGMVAARGMVTPVGPGWGEPQIELRWYAPDGASDAVVEGDCTAQFNDAVRRLYLSASHSLEFRLPTADQGRRTARLDDYGWIVDVE